MDHAYRSYRRLATDRFVVITLYTVPVNLLQNRLPDDWIHAVLKSALGLLGVYASWIAASAIPATARGELYAGGGICRVAGSGNPVLHGEGDGLGSRGDVKVEIGDVPHVGRP